MTLDGDVVAVSPSSVYRVLKSAGKLAAPWGKPSNEGMRSLKERGILWLFGNIDLKLTPARSTPERIVIGKRPVGVPLPELEKGKTLAGFAGEG
jgi:hypothetical protein